MTPTPIPRLARLALGAALAARALLVPSAAAADDPDASAAAAAPAARLAGAEIVDLTHPFDEATIAWPTEEGFVLERGAFGRTEAGHWYAAHRMRLPEHGGTHVDAPLHFHEGGETVAELALERLVGPAVVVDVRAACAADRDHAVTVAELEAHERAHGAIGEGAIVLLHTGFGARWPDRAGYLGTAERGPEAVAALHFPGLGEAAARWLVGRGVAAVGIDTASIDPGVSRLFESHRVLAAASVPAFENLAALDRLPPRGALLVALPMKLADGTGAPLRAIALLP